MNSISNFLFRSGDEACGVPKENLEFLLSGDRRKEAAALALSSEEDRVVCPLRPSSFLPLSSPIFIELVSKKQNYGAPMEL